MECFAEKNFIISLAIHQSPLGEVQWEPLLADELSHKVEYLWSVCSDCSPMRWADEC